MMLMCVNRDRLLSTIFFRVLFLDNWKYKYNSKLGVTLHESEADFFKAISSHMDSSYSSYLSLRSPTYLWIFWVKQYLFSRANMSVMNTMPMLIHFYR